MNYKIKVNSEAESKEAQELFFEFGYSHSDDSKEYYGFMGNYPRFLSATSEGIFSGRNGLTDCKEITLPELRDLVVLKRDNRKDANVSEENCLYDLYLTESKELYFYHCGKNKWILSNLNGDEDYYESLKPIEKPMKEYLNKETHEFVRSHSELNDMWINVPEGAIKATLCNDFLIFWKDDFLSLSEKNGDTDFTFDEKEDCGFVEYMDINDDAVVVWQRDNKQTIASAVESVSDKVESDEPDFDELERLLIETTKHKPTQEEIDNVNHPSHYASGEIECIDAMRAMLGREQFIGYLRGNMFKYQWRYKNKNGIEDLKKSEWYLNKLLEVENEL